MLLSSYKFSRFLTQFARHLSSEGIFMTAPKSYTRFQLKLSARHEHRTLATVLQGKFSVINYNISKFFFVLNRLENVQVKSS